MGWSFLNIVIFALLGYSLMFTLFKQQTVKYEKTLQFSLYMLPFIYIFAIYSCGAIGAYFIGNNKDFIEPLTLIRIIFPLICAAVIYVSSAISYGLVANLLAILCIGATVLLQPIGIGNAFTDISPLAVKFAAAVLGIIYCLYNRIFNILPHTFIIPNAVILFGICILGFIGATPVYVALCAALLCGILCAYLYINFYEIKIELDEGACTAIAYLIYSLLLFNIGEYSFSTCIIFTMILWAELLVALWNKYIIFRSGRLAENTDFYLAAQQYSAPALTFNILRICLIILFIGWFQLFASNQYSLLIVSLLFSLWLCHSLGQTNSGARSLKEINKEFIKELKHNIAETKEIFTKNHKDN